MLSFVEIQWGRHIFHLSTWHNAYFQEQKLNFVEISTGWVLITQGISKMEMYFTVNTMEGGA